jgi:glyoxylate/hydroxypyruvate reductase A
MGGAVADALLRLGYPVSAWTRRPRSGGDGASGVTYFSGADQLRAFAEGTDVLVCLLPLTDETRWAACMCVCVCVSLLLSECNEVC